MSEAVRVRESRTSPTERQNSKRKRLETIYAPMLRVLSYMSLAGKAKNERISFRKCIIYIVSMSRDRLKTHDIFCAGQNQMHARSWEHKARDFSVQFQILETN